MHNQNNEEDTHIIIPAIAFPVVLIAPIDALITQHEAVYCVASIQDCQCAAQFRVENGVTEVIVALKHTLIAGEHIVPNLLCVSKVLWALLHTYPITH